MKTVLCYGDSNTYGYDPVTGMRYPRNVRWTGILQELLGDEFYVVEEGCNGRTTVFEDLEEPWKNGLFHLKPCLNSHKPVDIVIMMLGSNDLKDKYHATAEMIAEGAETLVKEIELFLTEKQGFCPKIILVAPPVIGEGITTSMFQTRFDETAITRSLQFEELYREVAHQNRCFFFNAAQYVTSSEEDSLHLMPEEHKKLAEALYNFIGDM